MAWQDIIVAQKESKHELVLSGNEITERINKTGLDLTIFKITTLNYLDIHDTSLSDVPEELEQLVNLQTLVLHSNKIENIRGNLARLTKLKLVDLSRNCLKKVPTEISELLQLVTLNVSHNQLESLPSFAKNTKLTVLDASGNKLREFPDICYSGNNLTELRLSSNEIEAIPDQIGLLSGLKIFYLNSNMVKTIPGEFADCNKLKEINLQENPWSDKRLHKLVLQCHTKQVLDYIKQHCKRMNDTGGKITTKKGKKTTNDKKIEVNVADCVYKIKVQHFTNDSLKVVVKDEVKDVRPHLVACIILDLKFTDEIFKKFIQLQTKLHDTVCDKRNLATIATHDLKKIIGKDLVFTAMPPTELLIKPLNQMQNITGSQLFAKLQTEADNLRKEKKRNTYSGVHKYLYLLEGKPKYPCLMNSAMEIISFPPITNSDLTKMSVETTSLLIEVTSATSQGTCKKIADTLLKSMLQLFGNALLVQQVKNVDIDGNLKTVYPSRSDLSFEDNSCIVVERE